MDMATMAAINTAVGLIAMSDMGREILDPIELLGIAVAPAKRGSEVALQ